MKFGLEELSPIMNMARGFLELVSPEDISDEDHEAARKYYDLILGYLLEGENGNIQ